LSPDSPFGINTAFHPGTSDLTVRLEAMQQAGIKWGRQDFTWKQIEKKKGEYQWAPFDLLVRQCQLLTPMSGSTTPKRVWCFTTSMARKEWSPTTKSAPEACRFHSEKVRFMCSDPPGLRRPSAQIQDGNRTGKKPKRKGVLPPVGLHPIDSGNGFFDIHASNDSG
jgi:hypothetical protein